MTTATATAAMASKLNRSLDETQWVVQIGQLLERDNLQTALDTPTSIFKLPDRISNDKPEAYYPRRVALGPYHHFRQELYKMEVYKLEHAIKAREDFNLPEFNTILDELKRLEIKIRACFDRYLDMGSEALARIMLIDGLFLVQLLAISYEERNEMRAHIRRETPELFLPAPFPIFVEQRLYRHLIEGNLMTQDEFVKDLLMLENQIPLLVLKRLLPSKFRNNLHRLFFKFCVFVSPTDLPHHDIPELMMCRVYTNLSEIFEQSHHLLHFLYLLILDYDRSGEKPVGMGAPSLLADMLDVLASVLQIAFLQQLNEAVSLIQSLFGLLGRVGKSASSGEERETETPPLIPSASELEKVGVKLNYSYEDFLECIRFKKEPKVSLRLPKIAINAFSQVVFRNLVAFEAAAKLNPPHFGSYVTLMSGLISKAKDVKILEKAGIIERDDSVVTEEEVVKLFNGLRNCFDSDDQSSSTSNGTLLKMTEMRIVKEINQYYESCWKVRAKRLIKKYVYPVLKGIFVVIVIFLIAVVVVRTFCGWFSCSKIIHI